MGKYMTRAIVVFVSAYLLVAYAFAQLGVDILTGNHVLLFELLAVVYTYSEGKFHCKYLRHTMLGVFLAECVTRLDNTYDFLSVEQHNLIPAFLLAIGISISLIKSINHFYKTKKRHGRGKIVSN